MFGLRKIKEDLFDVKATLEAAQIESKVNSNEYGIKFRISFDYSSTNNKGQLEAFYSVKVDNNIIGWYVSEDTVEDVTSAYIRGFNSAKSKCEEPVSAVKKK